MSHSTHRNAFTLVELLITVVILGIISGMLSIAVGGTRRQAQETRARAFVDRLNLLVLQIYELESERRVSMPSNSFNQIERNYTQLMWKRDWLRAALPDRISDIDIVPSLGAPGRRSHGVQHLLGTTPPTLGFIDRGPPTTTPNIRDAKSLRYQSRIIRTYIALRQIDPSNSATDTIPEQWDAVVIDNPLTSSGPADPLWSITHQSAECLYLILATHTVNGSPAIQTLTPRDIADTDGDGMPEVVDPWGTPLAFMRWPVGFYLTPRWNNPPVPTELAEIKKRLGRDPLDLLYSDWRYRVATTPREADDPFPVIPMVISAGSDKLFDLVGVDVGLESTHRYQNMQLNSAPAGYATTFYAVDPFLAQPNNNPTPVGSQYGARMDVIDIGTDNAGDNVVPALSFER